MVDRNTNKQILIIAEAEVQYFSIKPLLNQLSLRNLSFDIYVPKSSDKEGVGSIFNQTSSLIIEDGYSVIRTVKNTYKIVLSPTDSHQCKRLSYKYLIHYIYAPVSVKPDPTYLPEWCRDFHAVLCHSKYEQEIMSVYAQSYLVPSLKYIGFKKTKTDGKRILYLPTWQEISSLEKIQDGLKLLRGQGYHITVKIHHGTTHRKSEQGGKSIKSSVDEYYESETPLRDLLHDADLVISDNSGSIFESMYVDIPVVVFGDGLNQRKLGNINTPQHDLVKAGIILSASNQHELAEIVAKGLKPDYIKMQKKFSDRFLMKNYQATAIESWFNVIQDYLSDNITPNYIEMHNIFNTYIDEKDHYLIEMEKSQEQLIKQVQELEDRIIKELNPGVKTATKRLLKASHKKIKRGFRHL